MTEIKVVTSVDFEKKTYTETTIRVVMANVSRQPVQMVAGPKTEVQPVFGPKIEVVSERVVGKE